MNAFSEIKAAVPVYDIAPQSQLVFDGLTYVYLERQAAGHTIKQLTADAPIETLTHEHLHDLFRSGQIVINEGFYTSERANVRLSGRTKKFDDLSVQKKKIVMRKKDWCDRYLALELADRRVRRSDAKLKLAIERIEADMRADEKAADERRRSESNEKRKRGGSLSERISSPSDVQLRRWVKRYEKGGYTVQSLVDQHKGPGKKSLLCAESEHLHAKFAAGYASSNKPSKRHQFDQLRIALNDADAKRMGSGRPPLVRLQRRAFEKMIDRLDPLFVDAGRHGTEAARRRWGIVTTGLDVEKPLQRVEMDEWKVSLMTLMDDAGIWDQLDKEAREAIERKRLWLSVAIDARTRMILAMRFLEAAPCIESALSTIELAMLDKTRIVDHAGTSATYLHAKPRSIVMDNASNYTAEEVTSRLEHLGIRVVHPPAGLAEMRARVERVFGTLKTQIVQFFSGQTFSNILEKGNYDAQGNASINVQQLNRLFLVGVLDLYHHHPHEGLVGDTPYNCMLRLSSEYGVPPPPDRDVVRHVMGTTCERRIGEEGIRFLGIRYQSPAVQMLRREVRQKPVEIRVDRWDLSSISVRVKGDGWITVDARFKGLENVSVWRWAEAVRDLQMRNQHLAKQSRYLVDQAVRTLSTAAAAAVERAEIENPVVTSETFEDLERSIFRSFSFDDDGGYGEDLELPMATQTDPDPRVQPNFENDPKTSSAAAQPKELYPDDDRGFGSVDEWSSN